MDEREDHDWRDWVEFFALATLKGAKILAMIAVCVVGLLLMVKFAAPVLIILALLALCCVIGLFAIESERDDY